MDQPWQIELFGWLRATQGDRVVARFRTRKAAALFAYLAYHRHRSHPRDLLSERPRLAEAFLQAVHELVGLLQQGDAPRALRWARRAVAVDPLGEESHHLLIRLLLESGQVEAARTHFEQSEHLLQKELGMG